MKAIHIRPRAGALDAVHFQDLVAGSRAVVDLRVYWSDTRVAKVYISQDCIRSVNAFVEESLRCDPVHEVGGFLLGLHRVADDGGPFLEVALEAFAPIRQVNYSSPVLLDFGGKGLRALEEAVDLFPGLQTAGWFHTHPGHGPFLSRTDLNRVHFPFFREAHHLAVVLDPLTRGWDTGFFSWRSDGKVNNLKTRARWVEWSKLG